MTNEIRGLRLSQGLRQRDVAREAAVELSDLRKWEKGLATPGDTQLERVASVLGVKPVDLATALVERSGAAIPGEGYTTRTVVGSSKVSPRRTPATERRVLDLFCGSGGFSFGFEQTGAFAVTGAIDLMPDRTETFVENHPYAAVLQGDIRSFSAAKLEELAGGVDILIGGPPCQGVSSIRPFRQLNDEDPRNNLMEVFARSVAQIRPRWFVMENVVGLVSHNKGRLLPELRARLEDEGYGVDLRIVNMALFGLPQNRERCVMIGNLEGRRFEWPNATHFSHHRSMAGGRVPRIHADPLFQDLDPAVSVMEAIHDLPPVRSGEKATTYLRDVEPTEYELAARDGAPEVLALHQATNHSHKMMEIIRHAGSSRAALPEGLTTSGFSSSYSRLDPDRPSVTLTVNFVHPASNKCIHPYQDRALTPREGARLQGFPDRFRFAGSRTQIVKQIGNAVPPIVGRAIAEAINSQW
jgi:DNA (cytosine-5)-methyltransferase 1